jgi:hypothetical protein
MPYDLANLNRPADGLRAAPAVQPALAAEDFGAVGGLRVRAAHHAGPQTMLFFVRLIFSSCEFIL